MNKEEIKELINDPIIKVKVTESTNILMDLYELGFNNGFKLSQSQLDIANNKLKEVSKLVNYEYSKEKLEKERWSEQFISGALTLSEDILSIIGEWLYVKDKRK